MLSTRQALIYTIVMGLVIFLCRLIPFIFFKHQTQEESESPLPFHRKTFHRKAFHRKTSRRKESFLAFVEGVVPPVAMTVLAFNSLISPLKGNYTAALPALAAAFVCAIAHIWKKNVLLSIVGGTAVYMILIRFHLFP